MVPGWTKRFFLYCEPLWLDGRTYSCKLVQIFIKYCAKLTAVKVLFFDGHASHISIEIINSAIDNDIELICLPPHSSSFLQPLDLGVFKIQLHLAKLITDIFLGNTV